jgi:HD-GYP domain-containing protein (c-di-GMP phosphodiesterase class II)
MPDGTPLLSAEPAAHGDGHYLQAIAEIGDTRKLALTQPIYAANGIKLLDAGASLTSRTLERLVGHRLAAPIENCLAAEGTLRAVDIAARARELAEVHPLIAQLTGPADRSARIWARLGDAPLPASVLFRLTVAREKFGDVFDHSLRAAVVALATGVRAELGDRELELLATAALMHDFGMLHADPAGFEEGRPLDTAARRQLRAHPLTGMLIAQREPQLNPAIGIAILQHHERLDGSGYPSAPSADRISRMARILMLVEIVLAMVEHRPHLPEFQLSLVLRANHRGFDRGLANILLGALPRVNVGDSTPSTGNAGAAQTLAQRLSRWSEVKKGAIAGLEQDVCRFIEERLLRLRRSLIEAGIDPVGEASPSAFFGDDAAAQAEIDGMMAEALWHVRQIAADARLLWPQLSSARTEGEPPSSLGALCNWLADAAKPFAVIETAAASA